MLDDYVTIESPAGTVLTNVTAVPVPTDPAPPEGVVFPVGLFDYEVIVANPGDPTDVTLHLPDGVVLEPASTELWAFQNGEWSDLTQSADVDAAADQITVELVDGGAGDEDLAANGVIDDPIGPGNNAVGTITITKQTAPNGAPGSFGFTLRLCATDQDPKAGETCGSGSNDIIPTNQQLSDDGSFNWPGLTSGRWYRLTENGNPPAPGIDCTTSAADEVIDASNDRAFVKLGATGGLTCTFTNTVPQYTITVTKYGGRNSLSTVPGAGFRLLNASMQPVPGQTCTTSGSPATCTLTGFSGQQYFVEEVSVPSWPWHIISKIATGNPNSSGTRSDTSIQQADSSPVTTGTRH